MKQTVVIILIVLLFPVAVFAEPDKPPRPTDEPEPTPEFVECATFHPFTQLVIQGLVQLLNETDFSDPEALENSAAQLLELESGISLMQTDEQCEYERELLIEVLHAYAETLHWFAKASTTEATLMTHWNNVNRGVEEPRPDASH